MRILEIEQLFQQDDTLNQVLDKIKDDVNQVDYYANIMKQNLTDNPEECKKALNVLTGVYMNLKTVLAIADTEKENREVRKYNMIKIDTENAGNKFVSASADKEARESIANYLRIRNIVRGYVEACEKSLSTLQSTLKHLTEEFKLSQGQ